MNNLKSKIINNINIVDKISEYVNVEKKGQNYACICPFHQDTNPSLIINEDKKIFKCFVCDTGGSVITFISKFKKISFEKAEEELALELGLDIKIKEITSSEYLLKDIMNFYIKNLELSSLAEGARKYLSTDRKMKKNSIEKFKLGYSSNDNALKEYLEFKVNNTKKYTQFEIDKLEVFNSVNKDFFNNRIVFPIFNYNGNISGFSGRELNEGTIKYLNSKESEVFKKQKLLYNLHNVSIENSNYICLFEGYMDVIAADKLGINNSIATMGTALSLEQIKLLKKTKIKNLYIGFDSDKAGQKAIEKSSLLLLENGFNVKIMNFGKYKDLDEMEREEKIKKEDILSVLEEYALYYVRISKISTLDEKTSVIKKVKEILYTYKDKIKKEVLSEEIAKRLNIEVKLLTDGNDMEYNQKRINNFQIKSNVSLPEDIEKLIICLSLEDKKKFLEAKELKDKNELFFYIYEKEFNIITKAYKENEKINIIDLINESEVFLDIIEYSKNFITSDELTPIDIIRDKKNNKKNMVKLFK